MIWISASLDSTSYANAGGQGDRTGSITVTTNYTFSAGAPANLVDGDKTANNTHSLHTAAGPAAGNYFRFDFGASARKYIDEVSLFTDSAIANGNWEVWASNDAFASHDVLATFAWSGTSQAVALTGVNETGYRYYQVICPAGNVSFVTFIEEFEFKITDGA